MAVVLHRSAKREAAYLLAVVFDRIDGLEVLGS